jgi:flavin-dependent dehydrogenase
MKQESTAPEDKLLLDPKDIERLTGMGRTKTRALLRTQVIPNFRIGKSIRVSRVVFERWLEERHEEARKEAERLTDLKARLSRKDVR